MRGIRTTGQPRADGRNCPPTLRSLASIVTAADNKTLAVDVAIVGAGPVGTSLALALTRFCAGMRVALIDRRPLAPPPDLRASAIAAGPRRILDALGVWDQVADDAEPVLALRLTDSGKEDIFRPAFLDFSGELAPGEPFAHLVPNSRLAEALIGALGDGVEILAPTTVTGMARDAGSAKLTLADGTLVRADLIVAADGAQSALRGMAGIGVKAHDYRQSGLVATIAHSLPHHGVAWQHFRPAGPMASLPLPGNRSSLVWTEAASRAAELLTLPPAELAAEIEAAMGSVLGAVTLEGGAAAHPLRLQLADAITAQRFALVGDAAHVIHPIAGQGLNLGLKDVAALAETVIEAVRLGLDAGDPGALARYQSWRRVDVAAMAAVTDGLNRLFSNDIAPLRAMRDLGLSLVDRAGPIKDALIRSAAASSGSGPRLLLGQPI
jgi:2-octaprenyl-6-methoxyphenol hydroxylase